MGQGSAWPLLFGQKYPRGHRVYLYEAFGQKYPAGHGKQVSCRDRGLYVPGLQGIGVIVPFGQR